MCQVSNAASTSSAPHERIIAFDILRIIAAFAVITIHVSAEQWNLPFTEGWEVRNLYDGLSRWCVPIFVMISGALFLDSEKGISLKKLFGKNLLRIVVAYFVWSLVYKLYEVAHSESSAPIVLSTFLRDIVHGHFHLWFLKMLMGLYVAIPVMRHICADKKVERYFLVLALATTFFLPFVLHCIEQLLDIECFSHFYKDMKLNIATGFIGYFMLGHYLKTNPLSRKERLLVYLSGILCAISTVVLNSFYSHHVGEPTEEFFGYLHPMALFVATALFLFVLEKSMHVPSNWHPLIRNISAMSFGIYLIHMLVVYFLRDSFNLDSSTFNLVLSIPCVCLLTFILSYVVIRLLYMIPIVNKYLL